MGHQHDVDQVPAWNVLPQNPRLFALLSTPPSEVTWTRSDGASVELDVVPAGGPPNAYWISPKGLLEAGAEYSVSVAPAVRVGRSADVTRPRLGSVTITPGGLGFGALCTPARGATLSMSVMDDEGAPGGMVVQIDVTGPSGTERLFARAQDYALPQEITFGTGADGVSLAERSMVDAVIGETYSATVTVYDHSGNSSSAHVPAFQVEATRPGGCPAPSAPPGTNSGASDAVGGCTLSSGRNSDSAVVLTALLLGSLLRGFRRDRG